MMWLFARSDAGMRFAAIIHLTITQLVTQYLRLGMVLGGDETRD